MTTNPRWIFIDVDGTLIRKGKPNKQVIEWCARKKKAGFILVLWSMAGQQHANEAAWKTGCTGLFSYIISKPGIIVDDKELGWLKDVDVKSLRP